MICEKPTRAYPDGRTGTAAGYQAHRKASEPACTPCLAANTKVSAKRDEASRVVYMAAYAKENKDRIAAYNRDRRDNRQLLIDQMKAVPCADCGGTFPPVCMDFDHLDGSAKDFNIGSSTTTALRKVLAEIAKCEVVCANCHRLRTVERLVLKYPKKVAL